MDNDRIDGVAEQPVGSIKETAGKATGDAELQAEEALDKTKGKAESAIGDIKDSPHPDN